MNTMKTKLQYSYILYNVLFTYTYFWKFLCFKIEILCSRTKKVRERLKTYIISAVGYNTLCALLRIFIENLSCLFSHTHSHTNSRQAGRNATFIIINNKTSCFTNAYRKMLAYKSGEPHCS